MDESVVLEEDIDPNYEPTEEELREYAEILGLVLPEDNDLMYLAREGIKARLPKEWKPCQTRGEEIYYFNFETGESVWEHPCDTIYKKKIKDAKTAKKNRHEKNKVKPLQQNKKVSSNLSFSPVQEQPESTEFTKRKKEIEEEMRKFSEQLKKEYSEKVIFMQKQDQKLTVDRETEEIKEKMRKIAVEKDETALKANRLKLDQLKTAIRKQLEKEESETISKQQKKLAEKVEEVKQSFNKVLEEEKYKIVQRINKDSEEALKISRRTAEQEIEALNKDLEFYRKKHQLELDETEELKQRHLKRMEKLSLDLNLEFEKEKKKVERDTEQQIKVARQEENGEISVEDRSLLYNLEKELSTNLNKEIFAIRSDYSEKVLKEKEKVSEQARHKSEKFKLDNSMLIKEELSTKEYDLKSQLKDFIKEYQLKKESDVENILYEHEQKLKHSLEQEEQQLELRTKLGSNKGEDERKFILENQIRNYQREIANYEHQLYVKSNEINKLKDEETKLRTEIKRAEIETEDLNGQEGVIEKVVIADLEKQIQDRENELKKYSEGNEDRVMQLERQVSDLKNILYKQRFAGGDRDEADKIKISLVAEKEELKNMQNMLKQDREKWNREMKEYKANPSERKRQELYNIKRIIEKNIQRHNLRVKELKQAEDMLNLNHYEAERSEDEEIIMEMWRNAENRPVQPGQQYTRQPWQNHNLHVYQRQVNKWSKSREYMKDVMTRHGSWLNNMKEQLNRVMSSPHTIKTFY